MYETGQFQGVNGACSRTVQGLGPEGEVKEVGCLPGVGGHWHGLK